MEREVTLFTNPEELINWLDENDLLMGISIEDAGLLLGYMEGHDYAIGTNKEGKFIRRELSEENGGVEDYSIDDVIDAVCEWNYELILDAEAMRNDPNNFLDFVEKQEKFESLKKDEKRLDALFDKTVYGKEIDELAMKIAMEAIEAIQKGNGANSFADKVSEEVRGYGTESKGRTR